MDRQEVKNKSIQLIQKLDAIFDKCNWQKHNSSLNNYGAKFELKLKSGLIVIGIDVIYVYNNNYDQLSEYNTKGEGHNILGPLWEKVQEKIMAPINAQILSLIDELDKL